MILSDVCPRKKHKKFSFWNFQVIYDMITYQKEEEEEEEEAIHDMLVI